MIRVVIDTNIVVSAMLRSDGLPEAVFNLAIGHREIRMYFSEPVMAEYEEVLRRPRLDIQPDKVTNALARIRETGLVVTPTVSVTAARDPDDNIFLECAQSAEAEYLVTGNLKDFPRVWLTTRIVTAREFMEVITDAQREPS